MSESDPGAVVPPHPSRRSDSPGSAPQLGSAHDSGASRAPGGLVTVADHLGRILEAVRPAEPVEVPVTEALGCVLAADVRAAVALPGFDNSAMDGYAVRAADVAGATAMHPVELIVDGDVPAGDRTSRTLGAGRALRIMTGAPVPHGADAVVPVEGTDGGARRVRIVEAVAPGRHVRSLGDDLRAGDVVARAGRRLGARALAVVAASGASAVRVVPRPRVAVVSTGDELVPVGTTPGFGEVVDSNSTMLVAAVRELGMDAYLVSGVGDTEEAVVTALSEHARQADAVVTTGGVSMGVYDAVKAALSRLGSVRFDKVAMQPGKPQGFGTLPGSVPVFTLPGNPVSALVSFEVFVAPALRVLAGRAPHETPLVRARAVDGWSSPANKAQFARVVLDAQADGALTVRSAGGQGSHMLGSLAQANALAVVPADVGRVHPGDVLACLPLSGADHAPVAAPGQVDLLAALRGVGRAPDHVDTSGGTP